MKTREPTHTNTQDAKLIAWGLKRKQLTERKSTFSSAAEPANVFFDYADSTVYNLANLATAAVPILHIAIKFILSVLNAIPWVSVILSTLNGLLRIVRALIIKDVDKSKTHTFGAVGAYGKRIWLAMLGTAGVSLGLASMFISTLAMPLTIASTAVDTINSIVKFCESVKRCIFPNPGQTRKDEIKRMFARVESFVVSATALTGTILLFTPLMPLGAGMLIGASVYALLDKYNLNPFKRIYNALKKKPDVKEEATTTTEETVTVRAEETLTDEQKAEQAKAAKEEAAKRADLFDKLYCQQPDARAAKKSTNAPKAATYQNAMTLFATKNHLTHAPIAHQRAALAAR